MDLYIGSILLVGFNFAPRGYLPCNGELLPINQNQALFALIGTTYGGDGVSNFAIPKISASALQEGLQYVICVQGIFPSRD